VHVSDFIFLLLDAVKITFREKILIKNNNKFCYYYYYYYIDNAKNHNESIERDGKRIIISLFFLPSSCLKANILIHKGNLEKRKS
jgi:hypothetical protein